MAQMASLLVVATVFVALWTLNIYILQSERGGLIHETKLPMQELEPKLQGGLIREGGRICGILWYINLQFSPNFNTAVLSGTLTIGPKSTPWKVCTNLPAKLSQGSGKMTPYLCASPSTGPPYPRSKSSRYAITYLTTFQLFPQRLLSHIPTPPLVTLIQKLFSPHSSALMPINFPFLLM